MDSNSLYVSNKSESPISSTPVEVLCTIFRLVCGVPGDFSFGELDREDLRRARRALALTCVNWNNIVANDTILWNTVFICETKAPSEATQIEVSNSGTSLLRVIVHNAIFWRGGLPIASYVSQIRERIGVLSIGWDCSMEFLNTTGLEDEGDGWANLEILSLIMSAGRLPKKKALSQPTINLSSRSTLKELRIATERRDKSFNPSITMWHLIPPTSSSITHLVVTGYLDAENVIAAINACPMLEKLTWGGPRPSAHTFSKLKPLPNLRDVLLMVYFPPDFLHFIQAPNLERLELNDYAMSANDRLSEVTYPRLRSFEFTSEWGNGVMDEFMRANSSLEEITVLGSIGESWLECVNDLDALPNLRQLTFYERDRKKKIELNQLEGILRARTRSTSVTTHPSFQIVYHLYDGTGQGRRNGLIDLSRQYPDALTCIHDS